MSKKSRSRSARNPGHFPADHCGNRKGRPKGTLAKPASVFDVLLEKTLTVTGPGGRQREMTIEEATHFFQHPTHIVGQFAKIKTMTHGVKDLPRFPTYVSHRLAQDMS